MSPALLLCISIVLAVSNNILLHKFGNRGLENTGDALIFNAGVSLVWIPILVVVGDGRIDFHNKYTWFFGVVYGVVNASFLLFKMEALASGSISITSLIGCSALIIPTIFGTLYWHEKFTILQGIGLIVLLVSLFYCVSPKRSPQKPTFKWMIFCLLFFIAASLTSITFKFHQKSSVGSDVASMMVISAGVSALILSIAAFIYNGVKGEKVPKLGGVSLLYLIPCALVSCLYNRLNIFLTGAMDSIIFFPVFNGSIILFASLAGYILFREKLSKVQLISLITGSVSILMLAGIFDKLLKLIH